MAQSNNDNSKEWFSDSSFWEDYAEIMFDSDHWGEVGSVVDSVIKLSNTQKDAKVLDMCCGTGRHSIEFASQGYSVTAVDITKAYLDAAKDTADALSLSIEFLQGDARYWQRENYFDLAINLFTSFGYFSSKQEDKEMLLSIYKSLVKGGRLVMEFISKEVEAANFIEGEWFERDGKLVLTEYSIVGDWEGLKNRWIVIKNGVKHDTTWVQRLYSASELKAMLLECGFSSIKCYGSYEGSLYDNKAQRLVAVATK